jgi:hypothetical protein
MNAKKLFFGFAAAALTVSRLDFRLTPTMSIRFKSNVDRS